MRNHQQTVLYNLYQWRTITAADCVTCLTITIIEKYTNIIGRNTYYKNLFLGRTIASISSNMVIDSIHTMYADSISPVPRTVGQVRKSAAKLVHFTKTGVALFFL